MAIKPQLGLTPRYVLVADRCIEIKAAIRRYMEADKPIPNRWIIEWGKLTEEFVRQDWDVQGGEQ